MSNAQFLIAIIVLQQGLVALMWLGAAVIGLARGPALHWCVAAAAIAGCLCLVAARDFIDPWLGYWVANVFGVSAMALLRRGAQQFCDLPVTDREHWGIVALTALVLAAAVQGQSTEVLVVVVTSAGLAWSLLRCAVEVGARLRFEFHGALSMVFAAPMVLTGSAFTVRAMLAPWLTQDVGRTISQPNNFNAGFGLFMLVSMLLLHLGLAAMVVLRVFRQLRHLSDHDMLTGLLNRRGFEAVLKRESERLVRYQLPFAVLSVDIDHFKQINDRYGHDEGDKVLASVAQTLAFGLRDVDRIARMGGEEFCVLLPHTDEAGAAGAAQRLISQVRQRLHGPTPQAANVTVSVGVAVAVDPKEDRAELMRRLDRALYRAKEGGRDRIELATAPASFGTLAPV